MHALQRSFCLLAFLMPLPMSLGAQVVQISSAGISFRLNQQTSQYSFRYQDVETVRNDAAVGVLLDGKPVHFALTHKTLSSLDLQGENTAGKHLRLSVSLKPNRAELIAHTEEQGAEVRFQTAGAAPAFGLADHAVWKADAEGNKDKFTTDVTGFADDSFQSGQGITRLVSNFVIYPKQQFAELLIDPTEKIVHTSADQIVQGVKHSGDKIRLCYFFGDPHAIYREYLAVRSDAGYKFFLPKYQAFGVGWEAFGALGWETNAKTIRDSVDRYLQDGYPLRWMVIGSGFWPSTPETMHETTSFGLWDPAKYPDPRSLIRHFRDEGLAVMLGLRITFIVGGPYSDEGVRNGYFLKENGKAKIFKGAWPKSPYYLLDAHNPQALNWYLDLVKRWQDYGINGWKEDFYGFGGYNLCDDKVDPVNDRLMSQGDIVIERNGYLSSNGDLHRINDFNYNQNQDRGPVNALAFAYSGFPFVYPDIVGGTFGEQHFKTDRTPRMEIYMMRNAQWAALHSSMGMGEPPWSFSSRVADVMLQSAKLHARLASYLYSNARKAYADGYPWTMTPLPLAFPKDDQAYGRENSIDRAYEWMIGDALLAAPLYGDDYETANTRDIYLPEGRWMEFDTGKILQGRRMYRNYPLPSGKTPMFIGGSGITLEEIHGKTEVCIYPIAQDSHTTITLPDNPQEILVQLKGLPPETPWRTIRVKDDTGASVVVEKQQYSFSFEPTPGRHYYVEALK